MGTRNRQRPTFEKRQREIARQERQAEKRARRRARAEGLEEPDEESGEVVPATGEPTTPGVD